MPTRIARVTIDDVMVIPPIPGDARLELIVPDYGESIKIRPSVALRLAEAITLAMGTTWKN